MMTLVVLLLGMMAGLAWFLPDGKSREAQEEKIANQEYNTKPRT